MRDYPYTAGTRRIFAQHKCRWSSMTCRRTRAISKSWTKLRSEMVVPMHPEGRCIGVFRSRKRPELGAFTQRHAQSGSAFWPAGRRWPSRTPACINGQGERDCASSREIEFSPSRADRAPADRASRADEECRSRPHESSRRGRSAATIVRLSPADPSTLVIAARPTCRGKRRIRQQRPYGAFAASSFAHEPSAGASHDSIESVRGARVDECDSPRAAALEEYFCVLCMRASISRNASS